MVHVASFCAITSLFVLLGSAQKVQALLQHKAAQFGFQWDSLPLPEFAPMIHDLEKITNR